MSKKTFLYSLTVLIVPLIGFSYYSISEANSSLNRMNEEVVVDSAYQTVVASQTQGTLWGQRFISRKPESSQKWEVSSDVNPLPYSVCGNEYKKNSIISSHTAQGDNIHVVLDVYGAGQGRKAITDIIETNNQCSDETVDSQSSQITIGQTIYGVLGDVVYRITNTNTSFNVNSYVEEMKTSLTEVCHSFDSSEKDYLRNPYYNPQEYTAYFTHHTVKPQSPSPRDNTVRRVDIVELNDPVELPEKPWPEGVQGPLEPLERPKHVEYPQVPQIPSVDVFTQEPDTYGPGCGWDWSGHFSPIVDVKDLNMKKEQKLKETQQTVNKQENELWSTYLSQKKEYEKNTPNVEKWNQYSTKMNENYIQWDTLNTWRAIVKEDWGAHVNAVKEYVSLKEKYQKEVETFNELEKVCNAHPRTQETPNSSPQSQATTHNTIDRQCENLPKKKPEELTKPQPYTFPEGFTPPDSWEVKKTEEQIR